PAVLESIVRQVEAVSPGWVVVDSFRSVLRVNGREGAPEVQDFVQRLALHLTAWEATTFLLGEFPGTEAENHPVFTVADGLVVLSQQTERNSVVRKIRVVKMRGQSDLPGLHTFRITRDGLSVFPRLPKPEEEEPASTAVSIAPDQERLSTGIRRLDEMLGGGVPRGYSVMVAGPSGSGKTVLSGQFIVEGVRRGEQGVIASFEKRPARYLQTTSLGRDLGQMIHDGQVAMVYLRPLDLSVDETLYELRQTIARTNARRVTIDSLSGFEMAVSPGFREDFRESLYRLVGVLTGLGVTVMMTLEIQDANTEFRLGPPASPRRAVGPRQRSQHGPAALRGDAGGPHDRGRDPRVPSWAADRRSRGRVASTAAATCWRVTMTDPQSRLDRLRDANEQLVVGAMRAQDLADHAEARLAERLRFGALESEIATVCATA